MFFLGGWGSRLRGRVILATFGVHFGDFRVIWGAKMKLKTILRCLVIWDAKLEPKSVLRHLVGPMAPSRGPLGAQGCHFGGFGGHFEIIFPDRAPAQGSPFVGF